MLELDINNELFPVAVGDILVVALASTLALTSAGAGGGAGGGAFGGGDGQGDTGGKDGSGKDDSKLWRDVARGRPTLADMYTYVCYGKVYRFEESENVDNL